MKRLIKLSFAIALVAATLTSCNCYSKMAKNTSDVSASCTPEVLSLNNGTVSADITLKFPAKYFNKKAVLRITPVMVFQTGELTAQPFYLQGSKIADNYKVVDFVSGATINEKVSFAYTDQMRRSKLQVRIEVLCGCGDCAEYILLNPTTGAPITMGEMEVLASNPKSKEALMILRECGISLADGVNTLQNDFNLSWLMAQMQDDFKRVTTTVEKADLKFAINSSVVKGAELNGAEVEVFGGIVASNSNNDRATQKLYANGYASPDGPEKYNEKLAKARSESAQCAVGKLLAEYDINVDAAAYGEDWEGFKELVEKSDIADKGLILQVLSLYDSSKQREDEIKNLSSVYNELKSDILPQLRRTQLTNRIDLRGRSDEEMLELVNSKTYSAFNVEEVLYVCGKLKVKPMQKKALLEFAAKEYNDARAYNNLGIVYASMGKSDDALKAFKKSMSLGSKGKVINKNMALANLSVGNVEEAKKYAKSSDAATKSIISAAEGDYTAVSKNIKGYNGAIALVQMGNYSAAKSALGKEKSADADYLRAVIAAREGDIKSAAAMLESAIKKNKKLAEKAESDVNLKALYDKADQI